LNKSDSLKNSNEELKKSVRLQESSQEIEDRHQDLLGHIKAVQYTHDLQGQLLSVNQETTEFLGYDKNSLLNMNIRNLLAPEVRHEFDTYLTEMKRQGNAKGLMLVQTATGEKRILIYNNTLRTEGVATPTVQGIAYDITKYIQTEKALRQVSGQLSIVLESLPIVCYISKAEGDYGMTYITHNIKAITGFEDTNFTSKSSFWVNRIHPEDAPRIFANLPQIFEKGYHEHQYRWQVADGSYKWFYDYMRVTISSNGKKCIIGMMQDITERKRAEEALLNAAKQWRTTFDGISDIVCLLDPEGKILKCNKALTHFLGKPFSEILNRSYWEIIYGTATPIKESPILRMLETRCRNIVILPINDRWFNITVDPLLDEAGSLIGGVYIMSDITEQKRAEEAAKRLSQENAIVAEIGRIISSTLNIEEVYERFGAEVHKFIPFERITINNINPKENTFVVLYNAGLDMADRKVGKAVPLTGTATEWVMQNRSTLLILEENREEMLGRIPGLLPIFKVGFRSMMFIPLISKDQVIGTLALQTAKQNAYTEVDLKLAERISNHIAGAIANAQLFIERKQAEEALQRSEEEARRLAKENATVAEIGRIISSTLNIEEVYERFAEEVRKVLPFDRVSVNTINFDRTSITIAYAFGIKVGDLPEGTVLPLDDPFSENILNKRQGVLILPEDETELAESYPNLVKHFRIGIRSMMTVPLISKDQVIGLLHFQSLKPNSYTESDLKLAERVGNQVAGAIANSQLFIERKRAEEALQSSEEGARRLAQENATVAEIGRIVSSTLNIEEVYEHFAEEVRKLIPLDRIALTTINPDHRSGTIAYVLGVEVEDRNQGAVFPLAGSFYEEIFSKQSGILVQTEDESELVERYPILLSTLKVGLRSMISVPLISKGQVIGVLHIRSLKPNAYTKLDLKLAERVGNQIAGAIANAQLFIERLRAEEKMRALEDQLRQAQKMEAIGRLAGGVAHDFNNLLTVIKGYSQISLVMLKEGDPLKENVEEIQKAANRAASLTKQLLVFSRNQILELKVFHLNTILQDLDKMLHRIIGEDIELVYSLSNDLGQVKTDPSQMEQVILNLAINAKDAMPSGGKLTIETSNATLDESYVDSHIGITPGDYVMLSVSDTGLGMTPEIKERIFEPFFTTKEKGKGTGLGLSIVYGIVKQSGGSIWVYSELGLGTTFKVFLPRIEEDAKSLRPTAVPTKSLQGSETILVVEDEEIVRKLACKVLEENGYRVFEASNGEEALHIVQKQNGNPIHLVVTDVVMPGMSGRQLVDRLVSLWPQTKALYMSGYTNDAIAHHGVLEPGIAYIQKPFTPDDLILKVRNVLDGT
jgi:PAS domain S-box-containing protein